MGKSVQQVLFEGSKIDISRLNIKAAKAPSELLKIGDEIELRVRARVVGVSHELDKDDQLVRTHTLVTSSTAVVAAPVHDVA